MATSRREPHMHARIHRTARNMSPVLKPTEHDQGLRRARSVPSSPDRKLSPSPASSSSNPRPSSSFNARTASSRSTFGSASSSNHGKILHSPSSMTTTKPGNTMRGKADKSGGTSLWPPALTTYSPSSKDMNRGAKSPSTLQKSKLSQRPGVDKMTMSSQKPRTQNGMSGALAGRRDQASSSARAPGATSKRKTGAASSVPTIQRTKSVPVRPIEALKIEEQEVELLMEFDEVESISTPSIEEHLQEWLPDPVELKHVDLIAYVTSEDDPVEPSSHQQEEKNEEVKELIAEEKHKAKYNEDFNEGEIGDVGINCKVHAMEEAVAETELKDTVSESELKEVVDETDLNALVSETRLKRAANETELKEAVMEPEFIIKEEAKAKVEKVMPLKKTLELVQGWRRDDGRSNEVKEDSRSKPMEERKSKVMALIGKFETAMSGRE